MREIGANDEGLENDALVLELIEAAVLAGAYRSLARDMPDAAGGMLKLARKWSTKVAALADEIIEEADAERDAPAPSALPVARRGLR